MNRLHELKRRRTFAIVSHPDAGKTTITEKLLLFGGAIQTAGAVRARRAGKHAASDFLKVEQERGISVSTSVMSFPYRDRMVNLLDTPGHEDFSEDTYRVLTAVDSALMVLDNAKGVESRTQALMDVCRLRDTPVMTFSNKLDREGLDPFELLENVEESLNITCAPLTWPIGMGQRFEGVYDLVGKRVVFYEPVKRGRKNEQVVVEDINDAALNDILGEAKADKLREDVELLGALDPFDVDAYLAGQQTPVFFGSAINNFGVKELLDSFVEIAPQPQPRPTQTRVVEPTEEAFSGFVFKIQANLDKKHHDRMAFLRITSGHYRRKMKLLHVRVGKDIAINNATTFLAQDRVVTEEAFPGDIIGVHNHGGIKVGDTFTQGEELKFTGIPAFAPELFRRARLLDPLKSKALVKGLEQLSEEGAAQLFRPLEGSDYILGAMGSLQFDVIQSRLEGEYKVRALFEAVPLQAARWVTGPEDEVERFRSENPRRMYRDIHDNLTFIGQSQWAMNYAAEQYPKLEFRKTMEIFEMTLEDRVSRLERSARRWRGVALISGALLAATVFMGADAGAPPPAGPPAEIEAQRFVLVDADGKARAWLGLREGEPRLRLQGSKGSEVVIDARVNHAGVVAMRAEGRVMASMKASGGNAEVRADARKSDKRNRTPYALLRAARRGNSEVIASVGGRTDARAVAQGKRAYFSVNQGQGQVYIKAP